MELHKLEISSFAYKSAPTTSNGIDRAVLGAAVAAVKRRYPQAHGRVALRVRLSPTGMVLDVMFDSPIMPALAEALRGALVGRRIMAIDGAMGGGAAERVLPELLLG